jgi:hypothetical protein
MLPNGIIYLIFITVLLKGNAYHSPYFLNIEDEDNTIYISYISLLCGKNKTYKRRKIKRAVEYFDIKE